MTSNLMADVVTAENRNPSNFTATPVADAGNATNASNTIVAAAAAVGQLLVSASSQAELVLFDLYLYGTTIAALVLNVFILAIVVKYRSSGGTENVIIAFDCVNNIVLSMFFQPFALSVLGTKYPKPSIVCEVTGYTSTACMLALVHIVCFYAYERSYFLGHPLDHARRFSKSRTCVVMVVIWMFAVFMSSITLFDGGRQFSVTCLSCPAVAFKRLGIVAFLVYALPGVIVTVYAVVKIKRLVNRSVGPTAASGENQVREPKDPPPVSKQTQKKHISTMKTILLVSGVYLFSVFPTTVIRLYIFQSGTTWMDLDTRTDILLTIIFRLATVFQFTTAPIANPVLYLVTRKHINANCRRLLGLRAKVVKNDEVTVMPRNIHL